MTPGPRRGTSATRRPAALATALAVLAGLMAAAPGTSGAATAAGCDAPAPGAALAWGANTSGQLGDGSVAAPGQSGFRAAPAGVVDLGLGAGVTQVAAGAGHSLALGADGAVWAWGDNTSGQLGDATTTQRFRSVAKASTAAGSTQLRSPLANFAAADVGRPVSGVGIAPGATIASVAGPSTATLSVPAVATPTPVQLGPVQLTTQSPGRRLYGAAYAGQQWIAVATTSMFTDGFADGTTAFSSPSANFGAADVGKYVVAYGIPVGTTVASLTSPTTVVLSMPSIYYRENMAFSLDTTAPIADGAIAGEVLSSPNAHFSPADVGSYISADNLVLGTYITAVRDAFTAVVSKPVVQPQSGFAFRVGPVRADDVGRPVAAEGVPADATVTEVGADLVLASAPATATASSTLTLGPKDVVSTSEGRTLDDTVATAGSTTLSSPGGAFVTTDVGRPVVGGGIADGTTVAAVVDAATATLSVPTATETVTLGTSRPARRVVGLPRPARAITAGQNFSLAALGDGSVWAWGLNNNASLGDGTSSGTRSTPVQVRGLSGVTQVAAGSMHGLALDGDGRVWAWGANLSGQLGVGRGVSGSSVPVPVEALPGPAVAIAAAGNTSLAVLGDGTVRAWGDNSSGQLGTGTDGGGPGYTPVQVDAVVGAKAAAAGGSHALALDADGRVWSWGANNAGELGDPGEALFEVHRPARVPDLDGVIAVAAGYQTSLALRGDGTVSGWGDNSSGQLALAAPTTRVTQPTAVPGLDHLSALAVGSDGSTRAHALAVRSGGAASLVACAATTPQTATVGGAFTAPSVLARDAAGQPVAGLAVTFAAPASGAGARFGAAPGAATATVTTGADGVATAADLVANTTAGSYRVTATAGDPGYEGTFFELTNAPGPPAVLTPLPATTPQSAVVTTAFATALAVRVADAAGNPLAGGDVSFAVQPDGTGGAGASFGRSTTAVARAGPDGVATAPPLSANTAPGYFTVSASVAGSGSVATFALRNVDGPTPASLALESGDAQTAVVGTVFPELAVTVKDAAGAGAVGAAVTFTVVAGTGGAGADFEGASGPVTAWSNFGGRATAPNLRANAVDGPFTLQASVATPGVEPVVFHLENRPQPAPAVESLTPASGPTWGGTEVTITGSGFQGLVPVGSVSFGGVALARTSWKVVSDRQIIAVAPPRSAPGRVEVVVVAAGAVGSGLGHYTYLAGGWVPAASMAGARMGPTASVVAGGKVLVAGGASALGGGSDGRSVAGVTTSEGSPTITTTGYLLSSDIGRPIAGPGIPAGARVVAVAADPALHQLTMSAPATKSGSDVTVTLGALRGAVLASAEVYDPASDTWSDTGHMGFARADHTATVLDAPACHQASPPPWCGRVLVAGGRDAGGALATGELYDPASGSFAPAGAMAGPRVAHTATLLADGRVLVAGGRAVAGDASSAVATAEVYDPQSGAWSATGAMQQARADHAATLLDGPRCHASGATPPAWCGQVLVTGGTGATDSTATYELYDPGTGRWSEPAERMAAARQRHSATALGDGTVLVAGGFNGAAGDLASAEVYDPAAAPGSPAWHQVAPMADGREAHTATAVVDAAGRAVVVVAGGATQGGARALSSSEAFDPATGSWEPRGELVSARRSHVAAALAGGQVLVAGGAAQLPLASAERYDPTATQPEPLITAIQPAAGPAAGGTTVVVRGTGFFGPDTVVRFGDKEVTPTEVALDKVVATSPPQPRGSVNVSVTRAGHTSPPTPAGRFTYVSEGWVDGAPLLLERTRHTATFIDGSRCRAPHPAPACFKVLVAGGFDEDDDASTTDAELYDPATGAWSETAPLHIPRWGHTATLLGDGSVMVTGGESYAEGLGTRSAEVFDPETLSWATLAPMAHARWDHTATLLHDGRILVAGGTDSENFSPVATAEVYDPATRAWSETAGLDDCTPAASCLARAGHTASVLADGTVLVVGGLVCQDGGCATVPGASAERYDPAGGRWSAAAGIPPGGERAFHTATTLRDGRVLVAGGLHAYIVATVGATPSGMENTTSAWLFDPARGTWAPAAPLHGARSAHSATLLPDATVLVAGGSVPVDDSGPVPPVGSAEVFDPSANNGTGAWTVTGSLGTARGYHSATVLDGPACHAPGAAESGVGAPAWCGSVLAAGGDGDTAFDGSLASTEVYTPGPRVRSVSPPVGAAGGGARVDVEGSGFTGAVQVAFGDTPAAAVTVMSPSHLVATAPAHLPGTVTVTVTTGAGSSAGIDAEPAAAFSYQGTPGVVSGLSAEAAGDHAVVVRFAAAPATAGDDAGAPARLYEVRESLSPIDGPVAFAAATPVCAGGASGSACVLGPAKVGDTLSVNVGGLEAGTTYHYAVAAVNDAGIAGPASASAAATTTGTAPAIATPLGASAATPAPARCPAVPAPGPGQVAYPAGYSLLGGPAGTVVGAGSPLYAWSDAGAGGSYTTAPGTAPVAAGRGYFAWFACPHLVTQAGPGTAHLRLALGAYHASMVANPSATAPVRVAGFDYAARWDPAMNAGAGGYHLSGFRQAEVLAVGEGMWVFSYTDTTVALDG